MNVQVVKPAGAGHETLWVLLAAACTVLVAAILIGARAQPAADASLAANQIDARTQLNAVEQGVHADLLVAAEEIAALMEGEQALPRIEQLREMELPPFAVGAGAGTRGGHEWRAIAQGQNRAYAGRSAAPDVAASMLLRLPAADPEGAHDAHGHGGEPQVWVQRQGQDAHPWPEPLDDAALTRQGWRQVVVRYDAGVTRKDVAH
ncbi:DUF6162 family protein [Hydrogenophaga sp. BPS33]|uniref:DUF6162 family protein n=1 Tax=Hydrogenophaga sp. BPS33 TaxID=2651974 RepID=UPI001320436E|nr:DUF6162 family protein [Hydrogenophaga sp. BPS33]QHE86715.1 hypothetical protein F9K07_18320 [Hydrogenophaga sp. BPS33]